MKKKSKKCYLLDDHTYDCHDKIFKYLNLKDLVKLYRINSIMREIINEYANSLYERDSSSHINC